MRSVIRAGSSVGRTPRSQRGGWRFNSAPVHQRDNMIKKLSLFIIGLLLTTSACTGEVKKHEFAPDWYPKNEKKLNGLLKKYLEEASVDRIDGQIFGVIAPHAGYRYSGEIAGYSFKAIEGKKFDAVIVMASAHQHYFKGVAIYPKGSFTTPIGSLPIDSKLAESFSSLSFVNYDTNYFYGEHMIELELPFILKVLGKAKIVPVLFSQINRNQIKEFALKLVDISKKKNILIVVSSDLSHYHPYGEALRIDWDTIGLIKEQDSDKLYKTQSYGGGRACGLDPIVALLDCSKKRGGKTKVLRYANSGDTAGMKQRVVGYLSAVTYKGEDNKTAKEPKREKEMAEFDLTDVEKKNLLEIARSSLESYLKEGKRFDVKPLNEKLQEKRGVFVTLKRKKSGQLRGCIGRMVGDQPLCDVVSEYAIHSALDDPRFPKVSPQELDDLEIEISVLTPFVKVNDINEIEVGKHGLMIQKGFQSGVLLPQVPVEWGWDRETFLQQVCSKAGLPSDAYKDKGANLYKFSAIVFSESDFE